MRNRDMTLGVRIIVALAFLVGLHLLSFVGAFILGTPPEMFHWIVVYVIKVGVGVVILSIVLSFLYGLLRGLYWVIEGR